MKAVILAGGYGTRLSEETHLKPKPMLEIGGKPILWHIMKIYSFFGINDFIICCGYRGYVIKEYFSNYFLHMSDVTFDMLHNTMEVHHRTVEPWRVTLVDTGTDTMTGGRLKRVSSYLEQEQDFCFTYGDGLCDIDISALIAFHRKQKTLATVTAVQPPARFGLLKAKEALACEFEEKPIGDQTWINGGFFVLSPQVLSMIEGDQISWEGSFMSQLTQDRQLSVYKHTGFWQAMDTLRDKNHLEDLWNKEQAPWQKWR